MEFVLVMIFTENQFFAQYAFRTHYYGGQYEKSLEAFEDELMYALGRLEAFGALVELDAPVTRLRLWMITLVCSTLQARVRYGDILTQIQIQQKLKDEVAQVLQWRFGLSTKEQLEYIDSYSDEYFARME